jgi:peptidyl-prolyl cis-trans isomerase A (cyclophilin A)
VKLLRIPFVFAWLGWLSVLPSSAQTNGIFADFSTSMGAFTVRLDETRAPRAVANFIGLATGQRAWLDPEIGIKSRSNGNFYAGTRIHGIVKSADGGTTNALALRGGFRPIRDAGGATSFTGDPGYSILQEITNGLSHSNGVIAMVNLGPHSAGSEYILTVTNVAFWDGAHAVFGNVVSNMAAVQAIAATSTDADGVPLTPVAVSNVAIRRVGAAALAFDINAQSLPMPTQTVATLRISGGTNASLSFDVPGQSEYFLVHTTNLLNPSRAIDPAGYNGSPTRAGLTTNFLVTTPFGSNHFFHAAQVHYPVFSALQPGSNLHFAATWSSGDTYHYFLDLAATTGRWALLPAGSDTYSATGYVTSVRWRMATANSTQINFLQEGWNDMYYTLGFATPGITNGRYFLEAYDVFDWPLGTDRGNFWYDTATMKITAAPGRLARANSPAPSRPPPEPRFRRSGWPPRSSPVPLAASPGVSLRSAPPPLPP